MQNLLKKFIQSNPRTTLIRKNILWSFLMKGWSGIVFILVVPFTLKCLGEYDNGIWLTISSLLVWIDTLDIGLGNGLRNKLATAVAQDNNRLARELVSSTLYMLILIILPAVFLLVFFTNIFDVNSFLNIDSTKVSNLNQILSISIVIVGATFILKFIGNIYLGMQLPAVNNFLITCSHTLILVGTYLAYKAGTHSLLLISVINTGAPLLVYLIAFPYTFWKKYPQFRPAIRLFHFNTIKELFSIGMKFFLLQVSGAFLFLTSNILISRTLSPSDVTPYQIAYRYFSIILLAFTIISTPMWSATTDAYTRGDFEWIKQSQRRMHIVLGAFLFIIIAMIVFSHPIYNLWIGEDTTIPLSTTMLMGIYTFVIITSLNYSNFLNGLGLLHLQLICTIGAATLFIPATLLATHYHPATSSILTVMILVNLPGLIVNNKQFRKVIKRTANGIWSR